jgi:hypothetical protein
MTVTADPLSSLHFKNKDERVPVTGSLAESGRGERSEEKREHNFEKQ